MTSSTWWRHRLPRLLVVAFATFVMAAVAGTPARAAFGSPQQLRIQLTSEAQLMGLAVGTVQFDDSNTVYRLRVTVCRQGSYAFPRFNVLVNGTTRHGPIYEGPGRPADCGTAYPYSNSSGTFDGDFAFPGTIFNLTICLEGVHFTYPAVKYPKKCVTFDNPFN